MVFYRLPSSYPVLSPWAMALFFRFVVGKMSNFVGTLAIVFSYSLSIWLVAAAAAAAAAEHNSSHIQMESFAKKERCGTK